MGAPPEALDTAGRTPEEDGGQSERGSTPSTNTLNRSHVTMTDTKAESRAVTDCQPMREYNSGLLAPPTTGKSLLSRDWQTVCWSHLGRGGDDGLQRCGRPWGIAGVTTGVLGAIVVVVVRVGGGAFQEVFPACRRFRLGVEGGGGGERG